MQACVVHCTLECVHKSVKEKLMYWVSSFITLHLNVWDRISHLAWHSSIQLKWLTAPCVLGLQMCTTAPCFMLSAGDLNMGSHGRVAMFYRLRHLSSLCPLLTGQVFWLLNWSSLYLLATSQIYNLFSFFFFPLPFLELPCTSVHEGF